MGMSDVLYYHLTQFICNEIQQLISLLILYDISF